MQTLGELTQDENSGVRFYGGDPVGDAALPLPLVVLDEGLQQQRAVWLDRVRNGTSQVDLTKTPR